LGEIQINESGSAGGGQSFAGVSEVDGGYFSMPATTCIHEVSGISAESNWGTAQVHSRYLPLATISILREINEEIQPNRRIAKVEHDG